jgi:DNA repair exonuclease SbcCD ATPase subunit
MSACPLAGQRFLTLRVLAYAQDRDYVQTICEICNTRMTIKKSFLGHQSCYMCGPEKKVEASAASRTEANAAIRAEREESERAALESQRTAERLEAARTAEQKRLEEAERELRAQVESAKRIAEKQEQAARQLAKTAESLQQKQRQLEVDEAVADLTVEQTKQAAECIKNRKWDGSKPEAWRAAAALVKRKLS